MGVGYCGLDARRAPRQGDEIEPCWEAAAAVSLGFEARLAATGAIHEPGPDTKSAPASDEDSGRPAALVAALPSNGGLWSESEI